MSFPAWVPAYIGVGSNLNDPQTQVRAGVSALESIPSTRLFACSKLYRSAPMGPQDQPHYVNAVAGLLTQLDASALLTQLKQLEQAQGRTQPIVRWGARVIDFDILVFGTARIENDTLRIPHAGIAERGFVLLPLMDVAPDLEIPGLGRVGALAARCDMNGLQVL
jgi:2-amino-4-hydroxy-6-hydroxymethyldihydropteridine diphosphokinase